MRLRTAILREQHRSAISLAAGLLVLGDHALALSSAAFAQSLPAAAPPPAINPPAGGHAETRTVGLLSFFTTRTPYEFWLTVLVALTGLATIWLMIRALERSGPLRPEDVTRPLIVVLITVGALILVIAGFSSEQIAPAFGLFGTIVGYMLGRMSSQHTPAEAPPPTPPQTAGARPGQADERPAERTT